MTMAIITSQLCLLPWQRDGQVCHSVAVETPESADEEEDPVCRILGAREFLSKRGRGGLWN